MGEFWDFFKAPWRYMIEPLWRDSEDEEKVNHWIYWIVGWVWAPGGLVLGGFAAIEEDLGTDYELDFVHFSR